MGQEGAAALGIENLRALALAVTSGDVQRVANDLGQLEAADGPLADACASFMGYLIDAYLTLIGETRLATLSDKDVGEVFITALARNGIRVDRATERIVKANAGHIVRSWRMIDGAWSGGRDFSWVLYMAVSASEALRTLGADPGAAVDGWIAVVSPKVVET